MSFTLESKEDHMTTATKPRVVIDFAPNGDFFVYSDANVEVICRHAHVPEDELYRYGHYPIPEEWLRDKPMGFRGDSSIFDQRAEVIRDAIRAARGA
jgi:hypothetical protein